MIRHDNENPANGSRVAAAGLMEPDAVRPLTPQEFEQIRQLAHRTFGLDLKPGKEELVSARLRRLVREGAFPSFQAYCRHVVNDGTGVALAAMIDALTTNHTTFLRESEHFEFLRTAVLPSLAQRSSIDLWCAACSTGEEVWTLACIINDALPRHRLQITATDISNRVLRFAERATYAADRCQGLPPAWFGRYLAPTDETRTAFTFTQAIRSQAAFRRFNLVQPGGWSRLFPIIFCRNVMIYFDSPTQEKVVRHLEASLEPGGYLFVGHAESLNRVSHSLQYVRPAVYRKPPEKRTRWSP